LSLGSAIAPASSWLDRWLARRDRLIGNPQFQRWAAAFPFTRPIARRRRRALFDLCAGFVYSQVLLACVRLNLFAILADGPVSVCALAPRLGLTEQRTERLLRAAAALGLTAKRSGGRFGLGPHGAALVGNPGLLAMIEHHGLLYEDLRDPVALLRGDTTDTAIGRLWPYARRASGRELSAPETARYTALMAGTQDLVAAEILDSYPFSRHRRLLDLGGGSGAFLIAVARRVPGLELLLFDLPAVAGEARSRLAAEGIGARVQVLGGDFLADPLPRGADLISLVRIIHDHDDDQALQILRQARQALPPEGVLLVAEPMAGAQSAATVSDAYFGFYLLAMGSGRPRTEEELASLLGAAGFSRVKGAPSRDPFLVSVLVASP